MGWVSLGPDADRPRRFRGDAMMDTRRGYPGSFSPLWRRSAEIFCTHAAKNFRAGQPGLLILPMGRQQTVYSNERGVLLCLDIVCRHDAEDIWLLSAWEWRSKCRVVAFRRPQTSTAEIFCTHTAGDFRVEPRRVQISAGPARSALSARTSRASGLRLSKSLCDACFPIEASHHTAPPDAPASARAGIDRGSR